MRQLKSGGSGKLFPKIQSQLFECQAQGLVPPEFIPQGETEREQYSSLVAKATCGWHGKYPHVQNDYQPRSERKLWGGPEPTEEPLEEPPAIPWPPTTVGASVAVLDKVLGYRDLPRGDAWEGPEEETPPPTED